MELLIGKEGKSDSAIIELSNDWVVLDKDSSVCISWKKVWDLESTLNFGNDAEEKFSGGRDGSTIARYRIYNSMYSSKSIEIYDYKGNKIYDYEIKIDTNDLFFYVTKDDKLIVLTANGYLLTFFAGREVSRCQITDEEVIIADFWDEGLVFLTRKMDLFYAPSFEKPKLLHNISSYTQFKDKLKVIPPKEGQELTVLVTNGSEHVYVITESRVEDVVIEEGGSITNFSINSNFTNIVFMCLSGNDLLLIVTEINPSISLLKRYLESREENLLQLSWCGCDFPVIIYEGSVNILLHNGKLYEMSKERYPFSGYSWVFQSSTYSLIFSSGALFKINYISEEFFDAFLKDDGKAASMKLVEAFLKRSSEKALNMKREGTLKDAMKVCQKTSLETDSPQVQQLFMYSANFARTYLDLSDDSDSFSEDIKKMRLANSFAIELNSVILPTYLYGTVSQRDVLYRICNRKRYSLALKIADYLSYDKRFIITEWCLSMAYECQSDETAFKFITSKFQKNNELFEINSIATALSKEGRLNLAKNVAELDPFKMNVVPFFISCEMWEEALNAAKNSYDTTLFIDTFNKAIDSKLEDVVIDIVKKDKVMLLNIAKLFTQEDYESTKNIEDGSPFADRVKAYKRVISENIQIFNPPNLNEYIEKLNKRYKDEKNGNKTKNEIFEEMILGIDYSNINNITDFLKGFSGGSVLNFFTGSNTDKYYVMIATVLARHKRWHDFMKLSDNYFSKYHYHYATIALCNFGIDHALEFVHQVQDPKKAKLLEEYITMKDSVKQYEFLLSNNIHFRYFHGK